MTPAPTPTQRRFFILLPHKLLDKVFSQSNFFVVFLGKLQFGKDVFGTYHIPVRITIQQTASNMKEGDLLVQRGNEIGANDERKFTRLREKNRV